MDLINLWWLCLGALLGWLVQWLWDWAWFRARRRAVAAAVEAQLSALQAERGRLAADLRACGARSAALEGEVAALHDRVGELEPMASRAGGLAAENARLRAELAAAAAPPPAALALGEPARGDAEVLASLRAHNVALHAELGAARRALSRLAAGRGDPLGDIDGLAPAYQRRLYEQGVVTFEQVAAMRPERLRSLVAPGAASELDTRPWIEQARLLADRPARDPLIDISGVGPVYEQRLFDAGVTSFEQLGALTPAELRAIIRPAAWQLFEPERWIAEARELARQVRAGTYRRGGG